MEKNRITEEQIIGFLKQVSKTGHPSERERESDNAKLKRLLAEDHFDMHAPNNILGAKL
jgi:hypothetical protein